MSDRRVFLKYVIPAVLSFALSGVYSIVDGFFVGNSIGDMGLSAINVAYPIVAVIQAAGTGIGMGGAVYYSIYMAEKKEKRAREFSACALWMLIMGSILLTALTFLLTTPLLRLLGAQGELLRLGEDYISVIALGAAFQVLGTGLVPFIRNHGGPFYAMISMVAGFGSNIVLDYLLVWVWNGGITGAALATVISQGVTMLIALIYLIRKKKLTVKISRSGAGSAAAAIVKIGIAPFGLSMTPNISLIIINRFSIHYGGDEAVAVYACIAYIICIIYLILQGVGDGSQPLFSRYYGEGNREKMKKMRRYAYGFAMQLALAGCVVMFAVRGSVGNMFGSSREVNQEIAKIMPVFLVSVPFVAVSRITTAYFYATEKTGMSYVLTFMEPALMLVLMLILPPLLGGQIMIWWSTVFARVLSACLALLMKQHEDQRNMPPQMF